MSVHTIHKSKLLLTGSDDGCCHIYKVSWVARPSLKGVLSIHLLVCAPVVCHLRLPSQQRKSEGGRERERECVCEGEKQRAESVDITVCSGYRLICTMLTWM